MCGSKQVQTGKWTHGAKVLLQGKVTSHNGNGFVLYTEGVDSDKNVYRRPFPVLSTETPHIDSWISMIGELVFENGRTQIKATGIKPAEKQEYNNLARIVGIAQSGYRYRERKVKDGLIQEAFAHGLVTVNGKTAYRTLAFDNPHGLAEYLGKTVPGSTVCVQGRLQFGRPYVNADGNEDSILEVVGLDKMWTKVLETPKIVDAFAAWTTETPSAPKQEPKPEGANACDDTVPF